MWVLSRYKNDYIFRLTECTCRCAWDSIKSDNKYYLGAVDSRIQTTVIFSFKRSKVFGGSSDPTDFLGLGKALTQTDGTLPN